MRVLLLLGSVVLLLFYASCSRRGPVSAEPYVPPEQHTHPFTPTPSPTFTPTVTYTPDALGVTCFNPVLRDFGHFFDVSHDDREYYEYVNGQIIPGRAVTYFQGIALKIGLYDGAGNLLDSDTIVSDSGGYAPSLLGSRDFIIQGSEDVSGPWHMVILASTESVPANYSAANPDYLDVEEVNVVPSAPTATATPPCVDMPLLFSDKDHVEEEYDFKLNDCTIMFYVNRWSSFGGRKVAYYDGSGALIHVDLQAVQWVAGWSDCIISQYKLDGTETLGIWNIVLYDAAVTPPATYSGWGGIATCPPDIVLEVY